MSVLGCLVWDSEIEGGAPESAAWLMVRVYVLQPASSARARASVSRENCRARSSHVRDRACDFGFSF